MPKSSPNPKVEFFFRQSEKWEKEMRALREILLGTGLAEEPKWGVPCYTLDGANVALIHGFKDYFAVLFHKGVLLKDPKKILIQQTKNVQAGRQIRMASLAEMKKLEPTLTAYLKEAIALERSGATVPLKKTEDFPVPEELTRKFAEMPPLKAAFEALTPGRQRGYLLYFSSAKQAKTREARIEKYVPAILDGLGVDD